MTGKRYYIGNGENCTICDSSKGGSDFFNMLTQFQAVDELNRLHEENEQLQSRNTKRLQRLKNQRKELEKQQQAIWGYKGDINQLKQENEQLKSDKEHLMGCLIRFYGYDEEDIDYNLNRESNREYGKHYYSMKEETKKELEE